MFYAIEKIGCGKRTRYCIKIVAGSTVSPVDGKTYRTEAEARDAAKDLGIEIKKVGDLWEII